MVRLPHAVVACMDSPGRRLLLDVLSEHGLACKVFSTVKEAREFLARHRPAVIFSDAHLTDGTFRDLLEAMARKKASAPLVVLSETADTREYLAAMQAGAFDFAAYPLHRKEVEWIVSNAVRPALAAAG